MSQMVDERTLRVAAAAREVGADWAMLVAPETVCYATGYEVPIETGPSPFQGGPPVAIVGPDGTCGIVVTNIEASAAAESYATIAVDYEGFSATRQPPVIDLYLARVADLIEMLGAGGIVGMERAVLPVHLEGVVEDRFSKTVDITTALNRQRATKTMQELHQLRRAAEIVSLGQKTARHATAEGRAELDAFAIIRASMETAHGARMAMTGDYISGRERTAMYEGWPNDRIMRHGDPVICDLSPRVGGYWGDSCDTLIVGDPTPNFCKLYDVAARALQQTVESVRPGVSAGKIASEVWQVIERSGYEHPLHIGHGIGTSFHEYPKIVIEEKAVIEPGMVLMMEPGACRTGVGGARLEWMFEVTETGNRILTDFEPALG